MKIPENHVKAARKLFTSLIDGKGEAILTSVTEDGRPHATWMSTMTSPDLRTLITLTSPDSHKVRNISANPDVEWLFTAPDKKELIYLIGTATILEDVAAMKEAWEQVPNKQRAYFLNFFSSSPGYAVIETTVEKFVYGIPSENFFREIAVEEMSE